MKAVVASAVIVLGVLGHFTKMAHAAPAVSFSILSANETAALVEVIEVLSGRFYSATENEVETDHPVLEDFETWEAPEYIRKNYPYYLSGFDDENRPIWTIEFGRYNLLKLFEKGDDEPLKAFNKYAQQAFYRVLKSVKLRSTPEEPATGANFIVDFADFDLTTVSHIPTLTFIIHLSKLYRNLIEKCIHKGIVINANFVAERLISVVRPILGSIMEKIEIYGNNRAKWIAVLRRHFPADQIPDWYGGNKGYTPVKVYG